MSEASACHRRFGRRRRLCDIEAIQQVEWYLLTLICRRCLPIQPSLVLLYYTGSSRYTELLGPITAAETVRPHSRRLDGQGYTRSWPRAIQPPLNILTLMEVSHELHDNQPCSNG